MAKKKPSVAIKPTTMRIPPDLKKRVARMAKRCDRSASYLAIRWIEEGVARAEKEHGVSKSAGALD